MINGEIFRDLELGQVWTPLNIATEMASEALRVHSKAKRILDPSCGPATFSMALYLAGAKDIDLTCYDVDKRMGDEASYRNCQLGFMGKTILQDYLADETLASNFDMIIMNPPYIRHELIPKKKKDSYHDYLSRSLGDDLDKRSNLFALFLLKGILDLVPNGILCAIVYNAISQSSYGKKTLAIMERHAELLSSKLVQAPFNGVLVDAQILMYRKRVNSLPKLSLVPKKDDDSCVMLGDLLQVRRGTALPLRKAYLASPDDPFYEWASPFFVKQSKLDGLIVTPDEKAYLADAHKIFNEDFHVWLKNKVGANKLPINKMAIKAVRGFIAFNYYIRKAPRHLWNTDNVALADNFYASNPSDDFPAEVAWLLLNSDIYLNSLVESARNQGNGLLKLQLYEYKQVLVPDWRRLAQQKVKALSKVALTLISQGADYEAVRKTANTLSKELIYD